ncbi:MAG: 23S rRNA (adenine(2503)-C(2))-methyltransferase RlmN [Anaerolineae bacterium]|nr:23S rRNA (adenine(2503)-C(2))-methyltransferase RlmN [Anaerolineae bacterium]
MADEIALLDLTRAQLRELLTSWGEPSFRADQVWGWLYRSLVSDFNQMRNLPKELRARLRQVAHLQTLTPLAESVSADELTCKVLFALRDGETIESVFMRYERRHTVCVSIQVGCPIGCPFCATGQSGFTRDLTAGEIVEQVLYFARHLTGEQGRRTKDEGQGISNVVLMGMGEPLLNYETTWQAIETLNDAQGFGLGARRITLSTAGVVPGIQRLSREKLQVGLAVSLHAPSDRLRDRLVPLNRRYPLHQLMAACRDYEQHTGRRVTFEYALMEGINDSLEQAQRLGRLLQGLTCHVNLIPLNPTVGSPYQPSSRKMALAFQRELERQKIPTTMRVGRGIDIQAGCGQLRGKI